MNNSVKKFVLNQGQCHTYFYIKKNFAINSSIKNQLNFVFVCLQIVCKNKREGKQRAAQAMLQVNK
jgi:hypothetical protein